ncbi:MAG: hypothetical protein J0L77_00355 [Alphaproteobacteria bacterium]|nr:hypothetical protein [Alphaproteobacteria bacterium]
MMKRIGLEPILFYTAKHRNRNFKNFSPDEVRFFNVELLNETIIPFLESKNGLNNKALSYRQLAKREGIEIHDTTDVNHPSVINSLIDNDKVIGGVSVRFLQVFEREIIGVLHEKGFFWNIHSGLLPDYKGLLIPPRAIMNGEAEYGLTLHDMACGIDEGGIILKGTLPLNPSKPVLDLYLDTVPLSVEILKNAIQSFLSGMPIPAKIETSHRSRSYYSNPTPEEWAAFKAQGGQYVDPKTIASRLSRLFAEAGTKTYIDLTQEVEIKRSCLFDIPAQFHTQPHIVSVPVVQL